MEMTKKEEKKADLEQLLNSLIEKGWKPFYRHFTQCEDDRINNEIIFGTDSNVNMWSVHIRAVLSKSSGLWQFVCENGMIAGYDTSEYYTNYRRFNKEDFTECRYLREYQYRIIESSLKDESELEDFLLTNIKADE